ncbi:MAG: hypothetical protein LBF66_01545 [Holosporales bacterium]|jgi:hypothetical protein|nr:hypothetical protein [Holosporales bacterium]
MITYKRNHRNAPVKLTPFLLLGIILQAWLALSTKSFSMYGYPMMSPPYGYSYQPIFSPSPPSPSYAPPPSYASYPPAAQQQGNPAAGGAPQGDQGNEDGQNAQNESKGGLFNSGMLQNLVNRAGSAIKQGFGNNQGAPPQGQNVSYENAPPYSPAQQLPPGQEYAPQYQAEYQVPVQQKPYSPAQGAPQYQGVPQYQNVEYQMNPMAEPGTNYGAQVGYENPYAAQPYYAAQVPQTQVQPSQYQNSCFDVPAVEGPNSNDDSDESENKNSKNKASKSSYTATNSARTSKNQSSPQYGSAEVVTMPIANSQQSVTYLPGGTQFVITSPNPHFQPISLSPAAGYIIVPIPSAPQTLPQSNTDQYVQPQVGYVQLPYSMPN